MPSACELPIERFFSGEVVPIPTFWSVPTIDNAAWSTGLLFKLPPGSVHKCKLPLYVLNIPALVSEVEVFVSPRCENPIPQVSFNPRPDEGL